MAGGLIRGLSDGISLGNQMIAAYQQNKEYNNQQDVKNVMAQGLADAKQTRSDDIAANSQVGSTANADNSMTMPTYNDTRGNSYANADEQKSAAEKSAPSLDELYLRNVAPKVKETYLAQGNVAAADQWDQWTQDKSTRTALGHLGKATLAGQMGDFKSYADNMVKTYNTPGYYEDGIHAEGYDLIKDKDGNTTGVSLNLKNKASGEQYVQKVNGTQDMLNMGIAALDPRKGFELHMAQQAAQLAAGAKANLETVKTNNGMIRDTNKIVVQTKARGQLEDQKAGNEMDRLTTGKQMDAANKKQELELRQTAGLLFKKGASPQEAHRMLMQGMSAKMVDFEGKPTMSPEELSQRATEMVEATYGKGALSGGNPLAGGLPGTAPQQWPPKQGWSAQPGQSAAPVQGVTRLDTKTGQLLPY
jgi:hypothetical protein